MEHGILGHLGQDKTMQAKIAAEILLAIGVWIVEEYCRRCGICQKPTQKGVQKAPFVLLPIASEPFSRIAMNIVGPLLRRWVGNKYMCYGVLSGANFGGANPAYAPPPPP